MPAFKCDLQRVLADQGHILDAQVIGAEAFHPVKPSGRPCLATTLCARARPSQLFARVAGVHPVFPNDVHRLMLAIDVNGGGKRVGVLQLGA
jgi:hypothetical protein